MRLSRLLLPVFSLLLVLVVGCGGGDGDKPPTDPVDPGDETRYLRAMVDGVRWEVPTLALAFGASHTAPGLYVIIGHPSGDYRLEFVLSNIAGAGTFPLGVSGLCRGGTAAVSLNTSTWRTPLSGAAGEITFTELSDSLMVGSFHFDAAAIPGSATGGKAVTAGEFRLPITRVGAIGPIPENAWSEVQAEVAGRSWNAANIATNFGSGTLSIVAFTDTRTITMTISDVQGPGVYPLRSVPPARLMTAIGDGVDPLVCCWGLYGSAGGSVTITSLTSMRVEGSFEANLEPAPGSAASGPLVILEGAFSNGLPVAP